MKETEQTLLSHKPPNIQNNVSNSKCSALYTWHVIAYRAQISSQTT